MRHVPSEVHLRRPKRSCRNHMRSDRPSGHRPTPRSPAEPPPKKFAAVAMCQRKPSEGYFCRHNARRQQKKSNITTLVGPCDTILCVINRLNPYDKKKANSEIDESLAFVQAESLTWVKSCWSTMNIGAFFMILILFEGFLDDRSRLYQNRAVQVKTVQD